MSFRPELPQNVKRIIAKLEDAGYEAYAVGGCVRDAILGRIPQDWDVTTSATPVQVKEVFSLSWKKRMNVFLQVSYATVRRIWM